MKLEPRQDEAIAACVRNSRAAIDALGVTRDGLDAVKRHILDLAARRDLFDSRLFPVKDSDGTSSLYLLSEDADHGFAMYAVAERQGNMSPPHNHTTWAVIAGIDGEELNRHYRRLDDGTRPGVARIEQTGETVVKAGTAVAFLPDDIHSIHCLTMRPTLNFHLYGRSIEHLPERLAFNPKDGTCRHFPANPHIYK